MKDRLRKLWQLFNHEDRLLILIDADPDSIASALALKRLLWRRIVSCAIAPIRPITRPQNQTMVKLLEIPLTPFDQINPADFNRFALVDSQPSHNDLFAGIATTSSSTTIPCAPRARPVLWISGRSTAPTLPF